MIPDNRKTQPKVSIITCIYNVSEFLPKCLESIQQQTIMPSEYEVIIVDDASTDQSLSIAKKFQLNKDNVLIIENKGNLGPGISRNIAIERAKGKYLYFLDGDDYLDPIAIETMVMSAIDNQSDLVVSGYIRITKNGDELFRSNFPSGINTDKLLLMKEILAYNVSSMIGNRLVKKSVFTKNNVLFPTGLHEDFSIIYKLFFFANNVFIHPDFLYYWVQRKGSTVDTISFKHIDGIINGLKSRIPFLVENVGRGFLRKVDYDLKLGVYKASHQMYRRIKDCQDLNKLEKADLFLYLAKNVIGLPEGYESITAIPPYDREFLSLIKLVHQTQLVNKSDKEIITLIYDKLPTETNETYLDYKEENDFNNLPESFSIKLSNFVESVKDHPGCFASKITYLFSRVIDYIRKHLSIISAHPNRFFAGLSYDVLFICDANYHIRNAAPIARYLARNGISVGIIDRASYLSKGKRQLSKDEKSEFQDLKIISYFEEIYTRIKTNTLKAAIFFNDWGDNNILVRSLRSKGIATIGINEGVNDFLKLGEGFTSKLSPYRTCEYAILPGKFDTQFFIDRPGQYYIGGLPKIRQLYNEPVTFPSSPIAVINVNFTYAVLTYYRDLFLKTAIEGCKKAGINYILTQHPMDNGELSGYNISSKNMYDTIREGTIFISRFSGAIIEALALGKPCVYHNPHNEQILKFQEPLGAYSISHDSDSLATCIIHELEKVKTTPVREFAHEFLDLHSNVGDPIEPNEKIAQIILDKINK